MSASHQQTGIPENTCQQLQLRPAPTTSTVATIHNAFNAQIAEVPTGQALHCTHTPVLATPAPGSAHAFVNQTTMPSALQHHQQLQLPGSMNVEQFIMPMTLQMTNNSVGQFKPSTEALHINSGVTNSVLLDSVIQANTVTTNTSVGNHHQQRKIASSVGALPDVNANMHQTSLALGNDVPPAPQPMAASSINVSTASYAPPKPQSQKSQSLATGADGSNLNHHNSSSIRQSQMVKLATVPTRKLASRSIISLNSSFMSPSSSSSNSSIHKNDRIEIDINPQQTSDVKANGDVKGNRDEFPKTLMAIDSSSKTTISNDSSVICQNPTSDQVYQREKSSYSSASDATIRAQQRLLRRTTSSPGSTQNDHSLNNKLRLECFSMSLQELTAQSGHKNLAVVPPMAPITSASVSPKRKSPDHPEKDQPKHKYVKVIGGKPSGISCALKTKLNSQLTLQSFLENLLQSRGYSNQHYCSLEGGYYCKPTELQKASYGMKVIEAVRTSDEILLLRLLGVGLSPNPCNAFGESIMHMVCRRGDHKLLKLLLQHGCSVQVSDDFGRTPLHDACWTNTPCFKSVEMLLDKDRRLLHVVDCRGSAPLSYVKSDNWHKWMEFFDSHKERWWPSRNVSTEGEEGPPELVLKQPHSMPLPHPPNAACLKDAAFVSSGKCEPESIEQKIKLDLEPSCPSAEVPHTIATKS